MCTWGTTTLPPKVTKNMEKVEDNEKDRQEGEGRYCTVAASCTHSHGHDIRSASCCRVGVVTITLNVNGILLVF